MSKDEEGYQGWTNRPTWIVNLWLSNEEPTYLYWRQAARDAVATASAVDHEVWTKDQHALFILEDRMKEEIIEAMPLPENGVYRDLMNDVLSTVNYKEIAEHWLDEVKQE